MEMIGLMVNDDDECTPMFGLDDACGSNINGVDISGENNNSNNNQIDNNAILESNNEVNNVSIV